MKPLIRTIFSWLARRVLARYHPLVIGVAGSVGKTSAKEAIATVVATPERRVRKTVGSFNAEIGIPVTIIAGGAARTSVFGWLGVLLHGLVMIIVRRPYPEALVLELGTDKPGDLEELIRIARPSIGVLTALTHEHLEFFDSLAGVIDEETLMLRLLPKDGTAIVNQDDENIRDVLKDVGCRVVRYGQDAVADVRLADRTMTYDDHGLPTGMVLKVAVDGHVIPIALPGVLGQHQTFPVLAALAVAHRLGDPLSEAIARLSAFRPPPGRMNLLPGVQGSLIIDDSYNASPAAMVAALETLRDITCPGKKYAIIGQMSELGGSAAELHRLVGQAVGPWLDRLLVVGELSKTISQTAVEHGYPADRVIAVTSPGAAAANVRSDIRVGDVVLVKGSRYPKPGYAGYMEKAVELLVK